jgi:hypothetical protein
MTDDSGEVIAALGEASAGTGLAIPALVEILTGWSLWSRECAAWLLQGSEDRSLDGFTPSNDTLARLIGALADSWVHGDVQAAAEHVLRRTRSLDEETLVEIRDTFWSLASPAVNLDRFERLSSRSRQLALNQA